MQRATLYTDGGARGNPGPAAVGYVLKLPDGTSIEAGAAIGIATNNQAEYEALERGLAVALKQGVAELVVYMDSELIVKQMKQEYRIKNQELRRRYNAVVALARGFAKIRFEHVPRGKNKRADELVNKALDDNTSPPAPLLRKERGE